MAGRGLLAGACIALIALMKLGFVGLAVAQVALFVLTVVLVDALLATVAGSKDDFLRKAFYVGLLFGAGSGLIGGVSYALPGTPEKAGAWWRHVEDVGFTWRYVRVIVISAFVGGALSLILQSLLSARLRGGSSLGRRNVVAAGGLFLVALVTTLAVGDTARFGTMISQITFGFVDWIGTGACVTRAECLAPDKGPQLRDIHAGDIAVILLIYAVVTAAWYAYRVRLAAGTLVLTITGLLTALYACLLVLSFFPWFGVPSALALKNLPIWLAVWVAFTFSMFQLLLWTRQSALIDALADAYGTTDALNDMLRSRLPGRVASIPTEADERKFARAVVQRAEWEGWLDQLAVNARFSRPDHLGLARVADRMGLGIEQPSKANIDRVAEHLGIDKETPTALKLQKIIEKSDIVDAAAWRQRMAILERCVCRVEVTQNVDGRIQTSYGTGFLVGPDLVLTAGHVVFEGSDNTDEARRSKLQRAKCRFDYKATAFGIVSNGTLVSLDDHEPCIGHSPPSKWDSEPQGGIPGPNELDFALLRLASKIGLEPVGADRRADGHTERDAPKRGWVNLIGTQDGQLSSEILWILQHPSAGPLKQAVGRVLDVIENGRRIRHDADTLEGSSGSPCFSINDLRPLGLHHAGATGSHLPSPFNQAVGLSHIVELIAKSAAKGTWPPQEP